MAFKKKSVPVDADAERLKRKKLALQIVARRKVPNDYLKYVEFTNTSLNPDADWKKGKHLEYLCGKIQEFIETDNSISDWAENSFIKM